MGEDHIVVGQKVVPVKLARARQLRREMTPMERALWAQLRDHRMCGLHFRRQQVIDGFIVDFYCHAARLIIEIEAVSTRSRQSTTRSAIERLRHVGCRFCASQMTRSDTSCIPCWSASRPHANP
jgi:very-short-patch-repair endonuclease